MAPGSSLVEFQTENQDQKGQDVVVEQTSVTCKRPGGRARSQSVATAQPSVETVVVKAKRAASTLWLLLHSQNCVLAGRCPFAGCKEAKLLHLHLKTCSASGEGTCCPTSYNGCEQSRKLLAHYRRCRSIRARQAGQLRNRESSEHHCLVCSLVARQAQSLLSFKGSSPRKTSSLSSSSSSRPKITSILLTNSGGSNPAESRTSSGSKIMPPPIARGHRFMPSLSSSPSSPSRVVVTNESMAPPLMVSTTGHNSRDLNTTTLQTKEHHQRARSASQADMPEARTPTEDMEAARRGRSRSASCGAAVLTAARSQQQQEMQFHLKNSTSGECETILEEVASSDGGGSVDKQLEEFEHMDLRRQRR